MAKKKKRGLQGIPGPQGPQGLPGTDDIAITPPITLTLTSSLVPVFNIVDNDATIARPSLTISKTEAIDTDTEGAQNAALSVSSIGNNTSSPGIVAQVNGILGFAQQNGSGDVVAIFGSALQNGAAGHGAFGGFFAAEAVVPGTAAIAVGTQTTNNTGADQSLGAFMDTGIGSIGMDLPAGGNYTSATAMLLRSDGSYFDTGISIMAGAIGPYAFYFPGGNIDGSGNLNHASDMRLKEDWWDLPSGALDRIKKLSTGTYLLSHEKTRKRRAGLNGQEVAVVIPEAVSRDLEDNLLVNDGSIMAHMIKAIQELDAKVSAKRWWHIW
jgi:hypothetical protein